MWNIKEEGAVSEKSEGLVPRPMVARGLFNAGGGTGFLCRIGGFGGMDDVGGGVGGVFGGMERRIPFFGALPED